LNGRRVSWCCQVAITFEAEFETAETGGFGFVAFYMPFSEGWGQHNSYFKHYRGRIHKLAGLTARFGLLISSSSPYLTRF